MIGTATRASDREMAEDGGRRLAELTDDPTAFATSLRATLTALADPAYLAGTRHVAPGIGALHGVRLPLQTAVARAFRRAARRVPAPELLRLADRLYREPTLEERWFAFRLLERALLDDPEVAWQLLREGAREAGDWITVDSLAHAYGRGILAEPYRWAEIEQLIYSPSRWERRLVGSTIATIPFVDRRVGRDPAIAARALPIVELLIGDDAPQVQKSLAWALRSLTLVDRDAVTAFCVLEAGRAKRAGDGHRAWVIRDVLAKLPGDVAATLRASLRGVRRAPGAPSTSEAAAATAVFAGPGGLPDPASHPRVPLR